MPPSLPDDEDQYASSEDSDFAPDAAPGQESEESGSEDEADPNNRPSKRRRTAGDANKDNEDVGYDNSGDEAIIKRGEKRSKKKKHDKAAEEDEGGEGGLIKTRRQRAAE